jgi:thymidylate synthase
MYPQNFECIDEMWLATIKDILDCGEDTGSRDGASRERMGFAARLLYPAESLLQNPVRAMCPSYAAAELLWYLSGENKIDRIVPYAPQYTRFVNNGVAHGAYGHRMADHHGFSAVIDPGSPRPFYDEELHRALKNKPANSAISAVISMLTEKPDSRQAVIALFNPSDLLYGLSGIKNDIPCTLSLQFILRAGKLNLICTMRSNDAWLGLPYDVFCFCGIQILVAEALRAEVGWYQHQVGSMHLYDRNRAAAEESIVDGYSIRTVKYDHHQTKISHAVKVSVESEPHNRKHKCISAPSMDLVGQNSLCGQLMVMAALKWITDENDFEKYLKNRVWNAAVVDMLKRRRER